eukprot:TRINITY_DN21214_c0_g1_i1.p1 TRINITY_DN21214_c0_g1~~TRINITY_DN21214_c0_g1_i1.p1  ORF type:complete len:256 (-),score=31.40 TRINITY_DN21214_c0_g1_i1:119-886(-)
MARVLINVGGTLFLTTKATLLKTPEDSPLHVMANGTMSPSEDTEACNGAQAADFFLDRPPAPFRRILNALRLGVLHTPEGAEERALLLHELRFYALEETLLGSIEVPVPTDKCYGWTQQVLLWRAPFSRPQAWHCVWCKKLHPQTPLAFKSAADKMKGKEVLVCATGLVGWSHAFEFESPNQHPGQAGTIRLDRAHFFGAHHQPEAGVALSLAWSGSWAYVSADTKLFLANYTRDWTGPHRLSFPDVEFYLPAGA